MTVGGQWFVAIELKNYDCKIYHGHMIIKHSKQQGSQQILGYGMASH